ncbi:fluoride efflux transporter FluC [Microbacterium hominis]|uniref:Fluoride-specific ion channel FluC n=1 Tax=Microbacterium hominis TaxID=162426 RepID=A0A7D4QB30_9MICO|nr:CrcB family protein [Microbacterium hominis]QKJ18137.1 CrcB family protein [Microbacterium hominis]
MPQPVDLRVVGLAAAGAAAGVLARAALEAPLEAPAAVAWTTMAINAVGSLLLGIVVGWLDGRRPLLRVFLGTGVMGGFTTYSAFAVQAVAAGPIGGALLAVASLAAGVAGAIAGLWIGRRIADVPGEWEALEDAE